MFRNNKLVILKSTGNYCNTATPTRKRRYFTSTMIIWDLLQIQGQ